MNDDFRNFTAYVKAMEYRDWMTCDLIAEENRVLLEIISELKKELEKYKPKYHLDFDKPICDNLGNELEIIHLNISQGFVAFKHNSSNYTYTKSIEYAERNWRNI